MATEADTKKDWQTIKVPDSTRRKASQDPRTYEEIILDGLGRDPADTVEGDVDALAAAVVERLDYSRLAEELRKEVA